MLAINTENDPHSHVHKSTWPWTNMALFENNAIFYTLENKEETTMIFLQNGVQNIIFIRAVGFWREHPEYNEGLQFWH